MLHNQTAVEATRPTQQRESQTVLQALRANMNLLRELAARYGIEPQPDRLQDRPTIKTPSDVQKLLGYEMSVLPQEQFRVILLNTRNMVNGQRVIYQGNVNSLTLRPAEVLRPAVIDASPRIIVVHNHPSTDPTPSPEDVSITKQLIQAAELLDIEVLDHVVIAGETFISMKEQGMMEDDPASE